MISSTDQLLLLHLLLAYHGVTVPCCPPSATLLQVAMLHVYPETKYLLWTGTDLLHWNGHRAETSAKSLASGLSTGLTMCPRKSTLKSDHPVSKCQATRLHSRRLRRKHHLLASDISIPNTKFWQSRGLDRTSERGWTRKRWAFPSPNPAQKLLNALPPQAWNTHPK